MTSSSVASTNTTSTTLRHHSSQGDPPSHHQPRHTKHKAAKTTPARIMTSTTIHLPKKSKKGKPDMQANPDQRVNAPFGIVEMVRRGPDLVVVMVVMVMVMVMVKTTDAAPETSVEILVGCGWKECSHDHDPVCGTDNITYKNMCFLLKANCTSRNLHIAIKGKCTAEAAGCPTFNCSSESSPVCGSDNRTYINVCWLEHAKCLRPDLIVKFNTPCEVPGGEDGRCEKECPVYSKPVCGTDNITYKNYCLLTKANCIHRNITVAIRGECFGKIKGCPPIDCTSEPAPVCGSDGRTYINLCWFMHAKCLRPELIIRTRNMSCEVHNKYCSKECNYPNVSPICASSKGTISLYKDYCTFSKAKCLNPSLLPVDISLCAEQPKVVPKTSHPDNSHQERMVIFSGNPL
ncbi:hypothetical protein Pcinc_034814 [Petrolisthes cinctipes]|uniref:Kazal-like domain-containing protein n=1 Tax=Petrolisthes cinctipes TaxID=88211 RepID=A0AAE1ENJ0_PETCI|nr:hypothetical protein Pcinc_034814 [Petrolisthes cinctipes]